MKAKSALRPAPIRQDDVRRNLIDRIDAFCAFTGLTDSQVGQRALKDTKFIARIRKGENFNMVTVNRLNDWLDVNKHSEFPEARLKRKDAAS